MGNILIGKKRKSQKRVIHAGKAVDSTCEISYT